MPATTQQLPNPIGLPALRRTVVMPRHPEYLLTGSLEQRVVDRDGQRRSGRQEMGHDDVSQRQSHGVARPAGHGEESVRAAVMPELLQADSGEHPAHRSAASLTDQTNNKTDERAESRSGKTRPEHSKEVGQRARYGGAGKHRRITLTRVVQIPSMLPSSHSKITNRTVTGVSPDGHVRGVGV
jgi:hypothetical protein